MTDPNHSPEQIVEFIVTDSYAGPNRRRYAKTLEQFEQDILLMFRQHEANEKKWIKELREEMMTGFPNGDLEGHCEYHESKIKAARAEEEFWKAAKSEAMKHGVAGLFAVLKWVLILAALGFAYKFGFGPLVAKVLGAQP